MDECASVQCMQLAFLVNICCCHQVGSQKHVPADQDGQEQVAHCHFIFVRQLLPIAILTVALWSHSPY